VVHVDLKSSKAGLQLVPQADVKLRGVIIGDVRKVESIGDGAVLDLAIKPEAAELIPTNVTAQILPKTLFGEKYVELELPESPSGEVLSEGDEITQTEVSIEVEAVLRDSYPLLRAVQPADLAYTLNALATALEGRGGKLGENLVLLDQYMKELNPLVPSIVDNLTQVSRVADIYRRALPDMARFLDNQVVTGRTLIEKQKQLQALFDDVAAMSSTTRDFLEANGDNLIRLGKVSLPTLQVLAKYAPEYPCLIKGMVNWTPHMASVYRDHVFHINLETLPKQPTGYTRADDPVYGAKNGPHCEALPLPPYDQSNPAPQPHPSVVDDGVDHWHGINRSAPGFDLTSGWAGTAQEQRVIDALASPLLRVSPEDVPDLATLLLGPIARGTEVSVR
jgi:phospholipid/cholesterol/gamma-HCH transport system substrate-binding protein